MHDETTRLPFNRLSLGSLIRIGFICNACLWLPVCVLYGLNSLLGGATVKFNNVQITGFKGLIVSFLIGLSFVLTGTLAMIIGSIVTRLAAPLLRGQFLTFTPDRPRPPDGLDEASAKVL
jgi:hypothetical protein